MKADGRLARIPLSLVATAAGWSLALLVTLPLQFAKIVFNATGSGGDLLRSIAEGTAIWGLWSLVIACGGWLLGFLPLIALVREDGLLRHPRRWVVVAALLGWFVVLLEFQVWKLVRPYSSLPVRMFILYTLLLVVFATVSAGVYLRLLAAKTNRVAEGSQR